MLDKNNYFIKEGYICSNSRNTAPESDRGSEYWNDHRIKMSYFHQYHVYKYASRLFKKKKLNTGLDVGCCTAKKLVRFMSPLCKDIVGIDQPYVISKIIPKFNNKRCEFYSDDFENPYLNLQRKLISP